MEHHLVTGILNEMEAYVLGKRTALEYAVACILAEGHLLIEDVPGVGKTTLAKSLAHSIHADFKRIQFTSDLLPSDLIGVTVFHQPTAQFEFKPGPIFTNVLLADEINRANPKTQSALLEAMHDAQISHDGKTSVLPDPFFVIATQNSRDNHGTFPLPESQLDRFLMKINLGYPDAAYEKRVISGDYNRDPEQAPKIELDQLRLLRKQTASVHIKDEILEFIYQIVAASREHGDVRVGVSPRGGQALYRAVQGLAFVRGRDYVIPDDVAELALPVCGHRMLLSGNRLPGESYDDQPTRIVEDILTRVSRPV